MKVKEYKFQLNISVESTNADYDRIELFAQELADSLILDHTLSYDDIDIVEANVTEIQDLNDDLDFKDVDDEDDNDEDDEYLNY